MKVTVKLFAAAKEVVGSEEIVLELPAGATFGALRAKLIGNKPQIAVVCGRSLFAANARYVSDEEKVSTEGEIAMIPPVSGG